MVRDQGLQQVADALGCPMDADIQPGGHYRPVVRDGALLYVSGQLPRLNGQIVSVGPVAPGEARQGHATLEQARHAARISALRALMLLQRELGSLDGLRRVGRMTVYVHCSQDFTQHSEVADAASDLLHQVLGEAGVHARSAIGVCQLPKNAMVEVELTASAREAA